MFAILALLLCLITTAEEDLARSMVPRGKVFENFGRHYVVRTKKGTNIHIRFDLHGKFSSAFGRELNRGDEFEPGEGLISLSSVARMLNERGTPPEGFWLLENDTIHGWVYELNGSVVQAATSRIIRLNGTDLPQTPALLKAQ